MKKHLLGMLICPRCLPQEYPFVLENSTTAADDIESGVLVCAQCGHRFPIIDGIAFLDPFATDNQQRANKYETDELVSSYLWSHFSDLMHEEQASQAYATWAGLIRDQAGVALDAGGAVGRFTFEMSTRCDFVVGIDSSQAFIRSARQLMRQDTITVPIKDEGMLAREFAISLPTEWRRDRVEFVVANALALPFAAQSIAVFTSLNLVDKVPSPLGHLREMNRVTHHQKAQFLLSDPFSWSSEAAPAAEWLGGTDQGRFAGKGLANIIQLLGDQQGELAPAWSVDKSGSVWWKSRNHSNHYELIRSCFVHASR